MQTAYIGALSVAMLVAACTDHERGAGEQVVRDSSAVLVVDYPQSLGTVPTWSRRSDPTLMLGEVSGRDEVLFTRVVAAFGGVDGTLVVAEGQSRQIRWFDGTGGPLRAVGGPGDGPGEFQRLSWVGRLTGDTIGAWDGVGRRLSIFSPTGDFLASHTVGAIEEVFDSPAGTLIGTQPQALGAFADGSVLANLVVVYPEVPAGVRRDVVPLMLWDGPAREWRRLDAPITAEFFIDPASQVLGALPLPFGIRIRVAVADEWAVIGWGDERGFTIIDRRGDTRAVIRPRLGRVPVTRDEVELDRRTRVDAAAPEDRDQLREALQAVPYPEVRPAHGRIVAGDGEFWVEETDGGDSNGNSRWLVFSLSGDVLGSVEVPNRVRITDVTFDHFVGVATDDLGVPRVVRFEVRRDVR